jgi:hypothetical protein
MKPEKENLLRDLLDQEASRQAILLAGGHALRRRRHLRTAIRGAGILAVVAVATVFCLRKENSHPGAAQVAKVTSKVQPVSQVRALTDDELLALFPNTPVGLASLADGKKRLIFPRPGDEERFITRL